MTDKVSTQNLSEILFKPKRDYQETSVISNSDMETTNDAIKDRHYSSYLHQWYRPITRFYWTWLGANLLDIDEALANISASRCKRSREDCKDTVIEYGPGNWIYEFSAIGQRRYLLAKELLDKGDIDKACHNFRMASRYFAIAAYPNLKGDFLASQAAILARQAYRNLYTSTDKYGYFSEETFKVNGISVSGFLHCKDTETLRPCIIMAGSYAQSAIDYYRIYADYLSKHGIAIFIIDPPADGLSANVPLDDKSSDLIKAAVMHLKEHVPFIDSTNIGVIGHSITASVVVRFAILNPTLVKAIALISPVVDKLFTDQNLLNKLSLGTRANLANRLGLDAVNWSTIVPQVQILSLKKQGLLSLSGNCPVNLFVANLNIEKRITDDVKLISCNFKNKEICTYKNINFNQHNFKIFVDIEKFFCKQFDIKE